MSCVAPKLGLRLSPEDSATCRREEQRRLLARTVVLGRPLATESLHRASIRTGGGERW